MRAWLMLAAVALFLAGTIHCVWNLTVDGWIFAACAGVTIFAVDYLKYEKRTEEK